MRTLTVFALIILIGYVVLVSGKSLLSRSKLNDAGNGTVTGSQMPSPGVSLRPIASASARIDIHIDTQTKTTTTKEPLIYPGGQKVVGEENKYETRDTGETVYNWYKAEMEKQKYQIRTSIKTRANDTFKGVLQGVLGNSAFKVIIYQESASALTTLILE